MNTLCGPPPTPLRSPAQEPVAVCRVNPLTDPEWDRLVALHPDAGVFHTGAWARVLHRTYGHQPHYLACHQSGNPAALIPLMEVRSFLTGKRGISVPFADFCGPLYFAGSDRSQVPAALTSLARERRWDYYELRGGEPPAPAAAPSVSFLAHTLDLKPGPVQLLANVESSFRRAIRKAERNGLTTEIRTDREAVLAFYQLHGRTRRRHGLPPQPVSFFLHIWEEVIRTGMGFVALSSHKGRPRAAAVFLHHGDLAVYKFGASDERFLELRANNLVMWEGIKYLAEAGFASLHFGRTSLGQDGLQRFKLGWGTVESRLDYYKFSPSTAAWSKAKDRAAGSHTAIFSRLPLSLNRMMGRLLYPHLD